MCENVKKSNLKTANYQIKKKSREDRSLCNKTGEKRKKKQEWRQEDGMSINNNS